MEGPLKISFIAEIQLPKTVSRESYKMKNLRVHEIVDAFYRANVIDDEGFLLLHEINTTRNLRFPYKR